MVNKDNIKATGIVERRLFDTKILERAEICFSNGQNNLGRHFLKYATKKQFKDNFIWKLINKYFHKDIKIPFVTGFYTLKAIKYNLVPTVGKALVATQLGGTTTTPATAIALGSGTTAAAAGNTALQTEITTNGGARGAATVTNTTTTTTGDTEQWVKTFTFSGPLSVSEEGLLTSNVSGGTLLAHQVFSAIPVSNGDSLQITHKVSFS